MTNLSLKNKTITGSIWSLVERFGYLFIQFISNLVLARLLTPSDFGTIGVLLVFVTLSEVMIDSGLGSALIQKSNITEFDKSTVFFTNLGLATFLYLLIFVTAPFIADYFHNHQIIVLLRVLIIVILIDSFGAIQNVLLQRDMNFKLITKIKIFSIIPAVLIAIVCALLGLGIWTLVIQYLSYSLLRSISLWSCSYWRPKFIFSKDSFGILFKYGYKLLASTLLADLYNNFQSILIGRFYSSADLGNYTQARQLQQIPVGSLSRIVNAVAFPALSQLQHDKIELKLMIRKNLKALVYINTPLMVLLSIIAEPLFIFLYSDKWIGAVPYFQILCIGFGILLIVHQCTLTALKALGRSDYVLKSEIIKKVIGLCLILLFMKYFQIWGILVAISINSVIELFINNYFLNKEIGYGIKQILKDFLPSLMLSLISGCITIFLSSYCKILSDSNFLLIILLVIIFTSVYLGLSLFTKNSVFLMYINIIKYKLLKR